MLGNRANLFAFTGGIMQIILAAILLFLPVFSICFPQGQATVCERQTYLQQGGSMLGLGLLALMIVAGTLGLTSTRVANLTLTRRYRWIATLLTVSFVILGAWSIGLGFVPGGILLLLSALLTPQQS